MKTYGNILDGHIKKLEDYINTNKNTKYTDYVEKKIGELKKERYSISVDNLCKKMTEISDEIKKAEQIKAAKQNQNTDATNQNTDATNQNTDATNQNTDEPNQNTDAKGGKRKSKSKCKRRRTIKTRRRRRITK